MQFTHLLHCKGIAEQGTSLMPDKNTARLSGALQARSSIDSIAHSGELQPVACTKEASIGQPGIDPDADAESFGRIALIYQAFLSGLHLDRRIDRLDRVLVVGGV